MEWYFIVAIVIVVLLIIFCFMFWCGNSKKVYKHDWLYKSYIAHRGYFNNEQGIVENTKTAFLKAIEKGYLIETDISLTKDNQIIVYHDDNFKRLFNVDKKTCELTLEEIKQLSYDNTEDKVLEFSEFLNVIDGKTGLLIEFKSHSTKKDQILCDKAMDILKQYKGNYVIQSFHPLLLSYFKKKYPIVPRGQLFMKFNLKEERKNMKGKGFKGFVSYFTKWMYNMKLTNCISRPIFIDHSYHNIDFMAKLCHKLVPMIVYTVTKQEDFDKLCKKVDNIIFENLNLE